MFNNLFTRQEEVYQNIHCEELNHIINNPNGHDQFEVLDVRTPEEYEEGHIPGARLINIMDPDFRLKTTGLNPEKTYYVYCRSGSRSMTACRMMADAGIKHIYNLRFGLMGWSGPLE